MLNCRMKGNCVSKLIRWPEKLLHVLPCQRSGGNWCKQLWIKLSFILSGNRHSITQNPFRISPEQTDCLSYNHKITSIFFPSQPPQQQSYTKDPQGGIWRPGKPQISVSCLYVSFVLLWGQVVDFETVWQYLCSVRLYGRKVTVKGAHSLFSQQRRKHGETCLTLLLQKKDTLLTVNVADSWCC